VNEGVWVVSKTSRPSQKYSQSSTATATYTQA
jgi:hypothetical protein